MTRRALTVVEAMTDPEWFGPHFEPAESWAAWRAFLAALFALTMSEAEVEIYRAATGRTRPPSAPAAEAWLPIGRRGGKSRILALIAVYLAAFRDWRRYLAAGERGVVQVIATDRRQARSIFRYARALLIDTPLLAPLVENETAETLELANGVDIEITSASYRSVRGFTVVAALVDEIAFMRTDENSRNPDSALIEALRPAMATVPGALLLCASSPYAPRGELWRAFKAHYGRDRDPVLVWRAPTRTMNPAVPQRVIDEAYERDPASAAAEFGGEFRTDVEAFLTVEAIDAVVALERRELPPVEGVRYVAFTDPSGGSRDSFTLAIAHVDRDGRVILDAVRERRPPFSPESVVVEFAELLKHYRLRTVTGDRYAGEWPRERFREHGIEYRCADKTKSDLYGELLPLVNASRVELLDHPRLIAQLIGLERRTARGGRDSIDHAPGSHDDVANSAAGVLVLASRAARGPRLVGAPPSLRATADQRLAGLHRAQGLTGDTW